MGQLAVVPLDLAPDQEVELLVGASELDVGVEGHGVVGLGEGVHQLVHRDRGVIAHALRKVVTLEQAGDGVLGREADNVLEAQGVEPFAVEADDGLLGIEDFEDLAAVGLGVAGDLFAGEGRAGDVAAGGVADTSGAVADDEDDFVAQVLKMLHLTDEDGVAKVEVGSGGVEADFDPEGAAFLIDLGEPGAKVLFADQLGQALLDISNLFVDGRPGHPCHFTRYSGSALRRGGRSVPNTIVP